jgi:two-component system chemotaxis response regulator CheY
MSATVLVVDDSAAMRALLGVALRQAGYAMVEARDGREALERLDAGAVDLVVSDCIMPVLDGLGLAREMRRRPGLAGVPIIMLTTESSADLIREGRASGVQAWMVKPFRVEQLVEAVVRYCPPDIGAS